jgi:hypothetical protein
MNLSFYVESSSLTMLSKYLYDRIAIFYSISSNGLYLLFLCVLLRLMHSITLLQSMYVCVRFMQILCSFYTRVLIINRPIRIRYLGEPINACNQQSISQTSYWRLTVIKITRISITYNKEPVCKDICLIITCGTRQTWYLPSANSWQLR